MTNPDLPPVTRYLRRMLVHPLAGELTDAQLLDRFVARRDEAAFEVLIWRHGPKVLGVCHRVLRHDQDAEDAFQATFLTLVRKAGSIGKGQSLGSWLYRVGFRTALRAKSLARKRATCQARLLRMATVESAPDSVWKELRTVLDEEVSRLPEKYRAPFVLCYLDGKTNAEAARELGCPKGTVLSRLAWARARLRHRLTRRGAALGAGLVGAALGPFSAAADVPSALVDGTRRKAMLFAAGKPLASIVSGHVASVTKGALQAMLWTKVTTVTSCVLAVAALGIGGGVANAGDTAGCPATGEQRDSESGKARYGSGENRIAQTRGKNLSVRDPRQVLVLCLRMVPRHLRFAVCRQCQAYRHGDNHAAHSQEPIYPGRNHRSSQ